MMAHGAYGDFTLDTVVSTFGVQLKDEEPGPQRRSGTMRRGDDRRHEVQRARRQPD